MKLKKSISLNWKIPVNVFKQNRTGFFPPAPTMHWKESIINETHFNHKATILKKLRLQKIGTPIKTLSISKWNKNDMLCAYFRGIYVDTHPMRTFQKCCDC